MSQNAPIWAGRTLATLFTLFMVFDVTIKLLGLPIVDQTMAQLGWWAGSGRLIGVIELFCLALYLVPRTAVVGAILMTGVLGGAIATHVRVHSPLFSHDLFGVYLGVAMWLGLWLRDIGLQAAIRLRRA